MLKLIKYDLRTYSKKITFAPILYFMLLTLSIVLKNEDFGMFLGVLIIGAYISTFLISTNLLLHYVFPEDEGLFFTIPFEGYKV